MANNRRTGMDTQHDAPPVGIARADVQAWINHDFHTAHVGLTPDVKFTITTTKPRPQTFELNGADGHMKGLASSARFAVPGSLRIAASTGDERNATLMLSYVVDFGPGNEADIGTDAWKGKSTLSVPSYTGSTTTPGSRPNT
jgi:hypothetical protein